ELHVNKSAAAEVHTVWDAVPEQHGKYAGHAEDQREGQKIPLFPKKIYVCIAKELHRLLPLKVSSFGFPVSCSRRTAPEPGNQKLNFPKCSALHHALCGSVPSRRSRAKRIRP